jgi:hypothetical protein
MPLARRFLRAGFAGVIDGAQQRQVRKNLGGVGLALIPFLVNLVGLASETTKTLAEGAAGS